MLKMSAHEATKALGGVLYGEGEFDNVVINSNDAKQNSLFVALIGKNTDGHNYIEDAINNGATVILSEKSEYNGRGAVIVVEDTLKALQKLAEYYREKFDIPIVAITGSVGKTTTKEFCHCVLSGKYKTLKTEGNYNSETGLPLTIFNLDDTYEAAVLEMGMSNFGEISALTKIAKPCIAVVTNIGVSHIEQLGSKENILKAKLEIERGLKPEGIFILNGDDELLYEQANKLSHKTYLYGLENEMCHFRAKNISESGDETIFNVSTQNGEYTALINAKGMHNVSNALAALCVGINLGIDINTAIRGLLNFENAVMRQNIYDKDSITVIDDCYNASPDSMSAALNVLSSYENRRRIAVLGDMLELGDISKQMHLSVGEQAAVSSDILIAFGNKARYYIDGAYKAGAKSEQLFWFDSKESAVLALIIIAKKEDVILFKASRGMKAEEIIKAFFEGWKP